MRVEPGRVHTSVADYHSDIYEGGHSGTNERPIPVASPEFASQV